MTIHPHSAALGATYKSNGICEFMVWAPNAEKVEVSVSAPSARRLPLAAVGDGYHYGEAADVAPDSLYRFLLYPQTSSAQADAPLLRADPASRWQPEGVHGPSRMVADDFKWADDRWGGLPLSRYIIYEAHVGVMTPEGTFEGIIAHLDELKHLGITALELMPIAQFPGNRNWGYDGVYPFAAQSGYGGPTGLKRLVDACHQKGLAVILDVVYNHLGPEGNYLDDFGPYFTDAYKTPWGRAVNFDGPQSDAVRRFFIENALYWITECRVDALRLDAVHAIYDFSARPFLEELTQAVHARAEKLNRRIHCIAESALNDTRIIRSRELGGFNLDAQWNDDFHHALHTLLTGEKSGYYADFGHLNDLAEAWREGYVYRGRYSAFRERRFGHSSHWMPARKFVVFSQNHDQIGNRMQGERLERLVSFDQLKVAAAAVLLSPFIPLLFMGEEYAEPAPFPYFVSHSDPDLVAAVREGRHAEFKEFLWKGEPPDPQDAATFASARLDWNLRLGSRNHAAMFAFYRELIRLRKNTPALARLSKKRMQVQADPDHHLLCIRRWSAHNEILMLLGFDPGVTTVSIPFLSGTWRKILDAADTVWMGPGSEVPDMVAAHEGLPLVLHPYAVVVWQRIPENDLLRRQGFSAAEEF